MGNRLKTECRSVSESDRFKEIERMREIARYNEVSMDTIAKITNPVELHQAAVEALTAALGPDNAQAFLTQYPGRDFTKERRTWPERSNEEIMADILRLQEARKRGEIDIAGFPIK